MKKENINTVKDLLVCITCILAVYFYSLNRAWIFYDERIIYDEDIAPILSSLSEIIEYLNTFGFTFSFISNNPLYASNLIQRSNLMGTPIVLLIEFLFKKNAFYYHCFNLFFHVINTSLVFFILRKLFSDFNFKNRLVIILLTCIWGVHPASAECVLLSTNFGALMSYSMYFLLFYDYLANRNNKISKLKFCLIPFIFLLPTVPNEYIFSLPLIIFLYSFINNYKKDFIKTAIKESAPYFIGLIFFIGYVLISRLSQGNSTSNFSISLILERVFWLAPQIFVHALKITFFPKTLSLDQSSLIRFGHSLTDPYSMFCLFFFLFWLILPIILLFKNKRYIPIAFFCWGYFLSFLPFSQILTPSYCLIAERYLYMPVFFTVLSISIFINSYKEGKVKQIIIPLLFLILITFSSRTFIRTCDWQNNCTLIHSLIKSNPSLLYKGLRYYDLAFYCAKNSKDKNNSLNKSANYFEEAIKELKKDKETYPNQPNILKSYGLNYDFLIIKAIYYICSKSFDLNPTDNKPYLIGLERFKPHLKNIDYFDGRTLEIYANLLVKINKVDEAKQVFLYSYKKYPSLPFIHVSLIRLERDFYNNLPLARQYLKEALNLQPYSKEILLEAMKCYQKEGDLLNYGKYSYLYGLRTSKKIAYQEALTVSLTLNDLIKSKKIIDKLLRIDKEDPSSLYLTSSYYIKIKDFEKAIQHLELAYRKLDSNQSNKKLNFNITNTLSKLYQAIGDIDRSTYFDIKAKSISK